LILSACVENLVDKLRGSQENVKEVERKTLCPPPDDSMARLALWFTGGKTS